MLQEETTRKKTLVAELQGLTRRADVASLNARRLRKELAGRLIDVKGLLSRHVPQARQILRKLVVGRLECEPFKEGGQRGYRIVGQGTYERLLSAPNPCGDPGGIRTRDLDLERVASLAWLDDGVMNLVSRGGIEPPTPCLKGRCSTF